MTKSIRDQLLTLLAKVDRPGTFCTSGELPATLPGLEVAELGPIPTPLTKRDAAELKKLAHQAPYGKGTKTLVDTDVRRVWEIDAEQITLANPHWAEVVQQAVDSARNALGLDKQKLEPHLYKLLLYETGSFFLPHRDGEKLDRMVATLVIALPSSHTGGELVVRHEGREQVVDFGPHSAFQTQFAAFYADCEHEIRPVKSGFRLALVYNLTVSKSRDALSAPTSSEHIGAVTKVLKQWCIDALADGPDVDDSPEPKLAVLLDHQYTEAGLTRAALKGTDRARADILFAAAREAGCDASLALVTYWLNGSAEYGGGNSRRRGRRSYEEYDEDEGDASNYIMSEVFDEGLEAEHFSDADGRPLAYGSLELLEHDLVCKEPIQTGKPSKEEFEGYTGNAGMTLDRWYHRAAVILWPAVRRFDVLCEAGVEAAVGGLAKMVETWREAAQPERESLRSECLQFADRIIANWPQSSHGYFSSIPTYSHAAEDFADDDEDWDEDDSDDDDESTSSALTPASPAERTTAKVLPPSLISLLDELDEPPLIRSWIRNVLKKDSGLDPGSALGDVCQRLGWKNLHDDLQYLFTDIQTASLERHARLLADLSLRTNADPEHQPACVQLASHMMAAVEGWNPQAARLDWRTSQIRPLALLPSLVQSFLTLQEDSLLDRLVTFVLADAKTFDLTTIQIPLLAELGTWLQKNVRSQSPALLRWLTANYESLQARAANPPQAPTDWQRPAFISCKCKDCAELSLFLADKNRPELRLPLVTDRRQHLHQIIDRNQLDTTHVTERRGRPYTLVCRKTQGSYERALKAHRVDLVHLAQIERLLDWCAGLASTGKVPAPKSMQTRKAKAATGKKSPKGT